MAGGRSQRLKEIRHVSTIRRERVRCKGAYNERDAKAHRRAACASCATNARCFGAEHLARVERGLCQPRSPEQIVGRAWTLGEPALPCCARIYTWLADAASTSPSYATASASTPAAGSLGFDRLAINTFEGGKPDSSRVSVAIERKSRLVKIAAQPKNNALALHKVLKGWRGRSRTLFQSLTTDQSYEFAYLDRFFLTAEQIFACEALSLWQKGIVENCNRLLSF